jgi:hypothetical protein
MSTTHEPFSIEIVELDHWRGRDRKNNFFELVYILEGRGVQCVNYMHSPYQKGSIFLLPASNTYTYTIEETTIFLFIRFTARFFRDDKDCITDFGKWFCRLNFIIGNYNRTAGDIVHERSDRLSIEKLITLVQEENRKLDRHSRRIMQGMMVSILEIIARNVESRKITPAESGDSKFAGMLLHIQFNLLDEDKITPRYLCAKFHIAETYFSEYFDIFRIGLKLLLFLLIQASQSFPIDLVQVFERFPGFAPSSRILNNEWQMLPFHCIRLLVNI